MKQYRSVLILALVAVVLGGTYFFLDSHKDVAKTGVLATLEQGEEIVEIFLRNPYGSFDFSRGEDAWQVEAEGHSYSTNEEKMALMVAALNAFPIHRVLEEELPEYGLGTPRAMVTFRTSQDKTYGFTLGGETASASDAYMKDANTNRVMVTTTGAVAQFTGSLAAYRSKTVLTIDSANITAITYYDEGKEVVSVGNTGPQSWFMTYPYEAPARVIELNELVAKLRKWNVAGYPTTTEKAALGLENPTRWLELTDGSGKTQRIEIGKSDGGTGTYVRLGDGDEIVTLYTTDLDFSVLHPDKLVFVAPLKTTVDQLSELKIETATQKIVFTIAQIEGGQRITSGETEVSLEDFSSVFFQYIAMNANGRDVAQAQGQAVAVLTSTFVDGTVAQLTLLPRDESTYYMLMDGKTEFYLDVTDLEQLLYRANKAIGKTEGT